MAAELIVSGVFLKRPAVRLAVIGHDRLSDALHSQDKADSFLTIMGSRNRLLLNAGTA